MVSLSLPAIIGMVFARLLLSLTGAEGAMLDSAVSYMQVLTLVRQAKCRACAVPCSCQDRSLGIPSLQ